MDSQSLLRECVEQLGKRNDIAGLTLDARGNSGIEVRDGRRAFLKLDQERNRVFVYRALLPLHAVDAAVLRRCMALNLLEGGTDGGVLSLSDRMDAIVYHSSIAGDQIDVDLLQDAMEALLTNGERVAQSLARAA